MDRTALCMEAVCLNVRLLLESGSETYRAEETAEYMFRGFGIERAEVFAMPTGVMLTAGTGEQTVTRIIRIRARCTDLARLHACNSVSRSVSEGKTGPEEALRILKEIEHRKAPNRLLLIAACALSSAFFCVMFGGGWKEFLAAFFCGTVCRLMLQFSDVHHLPGPPVSMLMSFLITLEALLVSLFCPELCTEAVISGALMPLVPGLMLTSAIRDTIRGDLVSGGARMLEALLTAVLLGAGAAIMIRMWPGQLPDAPASVTLLPVRLAGCLIATVMFGMLFDQPGRTLLMTGLLGTAGYTLYLFMGEDAVAYFSAALLIGLMGELLARLLRCPATMLITPGVIPLVPGLGLYRTMLYLAQGKYRLCAETGTDTLVGILAIALAITVSAVTLITINRVLTGIRERRAARKQKRKKQT